MNLSHFTIHIGKKIRVQDMQNNTAIGKRLYTNVSASLSILRL